MVKALLPALFSGNAKCDLSPSTSILSVLSYHPFKNSFSSQLKLQIHFFKSNLFLDRENFMSNTMPVVLNQPGSILPKKGGNERTAKSPEVVSSSDAFVDPIHLLPLANTDRLFIKQANERIEGVKLGTLGCDTQMRYEILNNKNQTIYTVEESSEFCERCWFSTLRPIFVHVKDGDGNTVIYLDRPLACQEICFPCCLQMLTVESPPGNVIGRIEQKWGLRPILHIKDEANEVLFIIKGLYCHLSCRCREIDFPIYAADGKTRCGKVSNRWSGIVQEETSDEENFGIVFPPGTDSKMKTLLLGAAFLTDYMYFETAIH